VRGGVALTECRGVHLQVVKLKAFSRFDNTTEALAAATALVDSKLSKGGWPDGRRLSPAAYGPGVVWAHHRSLFCCTYTGLKKFLKKNVEAEEKLAILDKKLGGIVAEKLGLNVMYE
jgi:nucleolar protein 58